LEFPVRSGLKHIDPGPTIGVENKMMSIVKILNASGLNGSGGYLPPDVRDGFAGYPGLGDAGSAATAPRQVLRAGERPRIRQINNPDNIEGFNLDLESGRAAYALLSSIADEILADISRDRKQRCIPRSLTM
jgi:hypothetical protein